MKTDLIVGLKGLAGVTAAMIVLMAPVAGQSLTAAQRADMCATKQATLDRLMADAGPKRTRINEQISDAEQLARFARQHRERLLNIPANQSREELNRGLNDVNSQIRLFENDAANAPAQRYRDRAKAQLEQLIPYRDFLAHLLASVESGGLIPAGRPEDDQFVRDLDRNVRQLRDQLDMVGSDINILRESMESLGCTGGGNSTGDMTKQDIEDNRNRDIQNGRSTVDEEEAAGGTRANDTSGSQSVAELPAAFKGKQIVRTERLDGILECWSAGANAPCNEPNLESFITVYYFSDGGSFWDRRDYDNKRKQMTQAGMVFRWACQKSLWRNGRCG